MQYVPMIWFFIFVYIAYCLRIPNDVLPERIKYTFKNTNKYVSAIVMLGIITYFFNFESKLIANKYSLKNYEYDQKYNKFMGFYPAEKFGDENYRWTGRNSEIKVTHNGLIKFKIQYHNIRLDLEPVEIEISIDGSVVEKIIFSEKANIITKDILLDLGDLDTTKILGFSISRTWSPKNYGLNDERVLGIAVSEIKSA